MMRRAAIVIAALVGTLVLAAAPAAAAEDIWASRPMADPVAGLVPIPKNRPDSSELVARQNVPGRVEKGLYWDGKTVTFHGEAIGESMKRGSFAWIHLNDDAYMERNVEEGAELGGYNSGMPVWLPAGLVARIDTYGDYKHEGTIAEVRGVFNGACAEHGGDTDIHATSLVVRPGRDAIDPIQPWKITLAALLSIVSVLLVVFERKRRAEVAGGRWSA
jgi:hypothetical protein